MRRIFVLLAGVIAAASWTACVGDDPAAGGSTGPATGDRLGPCFDDGKCKEGLECRLPERICLTPGEPVPPDAGIDASSGDAGAPADSGSGTDANAAADAGGTCTAQTANTPGILCGKPGGQKKCSPTEGCCTFDNGSTQCLDQSPCTTQNGSFFMCDGPAACPTPGFRCCLVEAPLIGAATTTCTARMHASSTTCMQSTCGSGNPIVCNVDADCPSDNCVPTEIALDVNGIATTVWGICQ